MFEALVGFLVRRRAWVLVVAALITAAAAFLAVRIQFDFSPQAVLEGDDDLVRRCEQYKATFGSSDAVVLVVLEATGKADALSAEALTWQVRADRRLAGLAMVRRVESLTNLKMPTLSLIPPWVKLRPIVTTCPADAQTESRIREAVAKLPLIEGALVSRDRRLAAMAVHLDPARRDIDSLADAVGQIRNALADPPAPAGYAVHLAGIPVLRVDIVHSLRADLLSLLPLAALGFVVVLAAVFRRLSGCLLPLLAVGVGLAWTTAAIVLAGESLNIVSNVLPILLFVIGMANCVHIVNRYAQDAALTEAPGAGAGAGAARRGAARSTMTHMAMACLLTSATTAIGFGSLLAARSTVLKVLGWQAMLGMAMLYVSTMVLFSATLGWFRPPATFGRAGRPGLTARIVAASGHAIARHPWPALLGSLALIAACLLLARNMVINSYMTETYDENSPTMRTLRLVENRLSGILPLGVSLQADKAETLMEPETFRKVAEVQKFAESNDQVLLTRSYVDLHRQVLALLAGSTGRDMPMPPPGEAGRNQIRLSGTIIRALGASSGYGAFVSPDGRHARILLRLRDAGTRRELELLRDLEARLAEAFPAGGGIEARLTDDVYLHARAMDRFVRDLLWSLAGASAIIFGVIAVLFWSARLGLAAILPNLTPLLMTLGYMGIRGYQMNAGNVIVFAISLGIAVDGTIHFLARFREEIKVRGGAAQAIWRSYISTGRAIVLTCLLIVSGLSVLLLSEFLPSRHFAELTAVTMLGALVGDLFLLPACLMLMWKRRAD
jgi:hypothetical protein